MSGSPTIISTVGTQIEHSPKDAWITNAGLQLEYDIFSLPTVALQLEYIPPIYGEADIITTSSLVPVPQKGEGKESFTDIITTSNLVIISNKGSGVGGSTSIRTSSIFFPVASKYIIRETDEMTQAVFSDYLEQQFMKHVLNGIPYTPPTSTWICLYTSNPGEEDSGTEVSGGGYLPIEVPRGGWETPSSSATQNLNAINFPEATDDWGTIRYIGIKDAQFSGSLLIYSEIKNPKRIDEGDQYGIQVGGLDLIMMSHASHYLGNAFLDHVLNGVTFDTPGSSIYLALYNIPNGPTDSGTEVSTSSYSRVNYSNWSSPLEGVCWNLSDITFENTSASVSWGEIQGIGLKDAETGGNLLFYGTFTVPKTVGPEDNFKMNDTKFKISIE
jgi:hypothetical protein